ncbi:MAG: outer membrane lipoprotein-sorting protein [Pseudomonadota bacterium]
MTIEHTRRLFERITAHPKCVVAIALAAIAVAGYGLTGLVKDTSVKAFIPPGHESLLADNLASDVFGLTDTIAVAVLAKDGGSVFRPQILALIDDLSHEIAMMPNVRFDRMASLATESSISGGDGSVYVDPYFDGLSTDTAADDARKRWQVMQPHQGTLVSKDETGAIVMAELIDSGAADQTYLDIRGLAGTVSLDGVALHVAGPGAVSGYLSRYIDDDARRLQPLVFALVLGFIYLAFRRAAALPAPLLVVTGAAVGALGIMTWADVPYFAITNALPVIIVAISVADAIHILSAYYQLREQRPEANERELVVEAMTAMARPITLTTVTTIAGFAGIAVMSIMPPITWFAVFASVGVLLAWLLSMLVMPNVLLLVSPGRSPAFASWQQGRPSRTGLALSRLGTYSPIRHRWVLLAFFVVSVVAATGAAQLRIDRSQVENFAADEPIRIADETINDRFAGTAFLDVIISTAQPGELLTLETMHKVRALQSFFESLPHVTKTVSIVDYLSQLHGALDGIPVDGMKERPLPASDELLAETLFVYEVTGDPADLDEEIDRDYQYAMVRGVLDAHHFSETRLAVEALQGYIDEHFNEPGLHAALTGDVNVTYHWMSSLQDSHFKGVALSLILVLLASVIVFRSLVAGLVSVVPVVFTVLVLYACMGFMGIYLEPATSMFAAIALGVGVDFAIHLVDRLRSAIEEYGDLATAIDRALPSVARACFFNSAALGIGFSVLLVSDLPTLSRFGGLVSLATLTSYLAALVIVPALFVAERDWFGGSTWPRRGVGYPVLLLALFVAAAGPFARDAHAGVPRGEQIAEAIAARKEAPATHRTIDMTLTDRRGRSETRVAVVHKQSSEALRTTRIAFLEPRKYGDMIFLSHDYSGAGAADGRWMYLPAAQRVRSIPATRRGNAFFGTDFSYEDVQSELKFKLDDWDFEYGGSLDVDGRPHHQLSGTPRNQRVARELGYGKFDAIVDETSWMPVHITFADHKLRPIKTIDVSAVELIDGIWTPGRIVATNHRTEHRTELVFRDTAYPDSLDRRLFDPRGLGRRLAGAGED